MCKRNASSCGKLELAVSLWNLRRLVNTDKNYLVVEFCNYGLDLSINGARDTFVNASKSLLAWTDQSSFH